MYHCPLFLVAAVLLLGRAAVAEDKRFLDSWKPGDNWDIHVDEYPKDGEAKTSLLHLVVLAPEKWEKVPVWRLAFIVPAKPKAEQFVTLIAQTDGWPMKSFRILAKDVPDQPLVKVGSARVFKNVPDGIPAEVFPFAGPTSILEENKDGRLDLTVNEEEGLLILRATVDVAGQKVKIRQVWAAGDPWWREYERSVNGRKDLVARRVARVAAPEKKPAAWKEGFAAASDPRCQAKVSVSDPHPELPELLRILEKATGLSFEIDGKLTGHAPAFGFLSMKGAPAWNLMKLIAEQELEQGRWDKTETGYRLTAKASVVKTRPKPVETAAKERPVNLRGDPRLKSLVALADARPKLAVLLDELRGATRLELTLAEQLAGHNPDFGVISTKNPYYAWQLMNLIAEKELRDGRWEKTDTGYRLTGTSLGSPDAPPRWNVSLLIALGALGVAGAGVAYQMRRRRKVRQAGAEPSDRAASGV